jgi:hypothetical protein
MDLIESRPAGKPLFDDLVPDRFGCRGGAASKRLGRFIRVKMGLVDKRIAPCRSFRHRFKDMGRDAEIHKVLHDALTGHTEGDVGALYGEGFTLKRLSDEIAKIKWIDVDGKPTGGAGD